MLGISFPNYSFNDYSRFYLVAISYLFYIFAFVALITGIKYVTKEGVNSLWKQKKPVEKSEKATDLYAPMVSKNQLMRETFIAGQKALVLEDFFQMMIKDLEVAPCRVGIHSVCFEFLSNIQNVIEFKSVEKKRLETYRNRKNVLVISS